MEPNSLINRGTRIFVSTVVGAAVFFAVIGLWSFRTYSVLNVPGKPGLGQRWGMEDFRDAVYFPARAFLDGDNPYDPVSYPRSHPVEPIYFLYSPSALVINLPFGVLPFYWAQLVFFLFNVALIPTIALLLLRLTGLTSTPPRIFWLSAFIAAGRPVYGALTMGQSSLLITLGVILALGHSRARPALAGIGFALAATKPSFGVPLAILMLVRRDLKALANGLLISFAVGIIPTLILAHSSGGVISFLIRIRKNISLYTNVPRPALEAMGWMRVDASVALVRLFQLPQISWLGVAVAAVVLALASTAILRISRHRDSRDWRLLSATIVCLAILISVLHLVYDGVVIVLPLIMLVWARNHTLVGIPRSARVLLVGSLVGFWFNYLATHTALQTFGFEREELGWALATSLNSIMLVVAFGISVALAYRNGVDSTVTAA